VEKITRIVTPIAKDAVMFLWTWIREYDHHLNLLKKKVIERRRNSLSWAAPNRDGALCPFSGPWEDYGEDSLHQHL